MRLLIFTSNIAAGEWAKEILEEFGRGMHISVVPDSKPQVLKGNWSYIITLGETTAETDGKAHTGYPIPMNDDERALLRRSLWALYRDTLRDMIGNKCSCGLYDTCHCH